MGPSLTPAVAVAVLTALPRAHRTAVTLDVTAEGAVRLAFPALHACESQLRAVRSHTPGSPGYERAQRQMQKELIRQVQAIRGACTAGLRRAGYEVTGGEGEILSDTSVGLRPLVAARVAYGEAATPGGRAWEDGVEAGWDHQNWLEAYGMQGDRRNPDVPPRHRGQPEAYTQGWREGRSRYRRNCFSDGTPRPQ